MKTISCPLCKEACSFVAVSVPGGDTDIRKYGSLYAGKKVSEWKVCGQCGFVHQNPRPSAEALNDLYLKSQYHNAAPQSTREEHLEFAHWYFSEKIAFALRQSKLERGCVFDVGCGRGGVLKLYEERGWKAYGVEPDQNLANFAATELGLRGVKQGILDSRFELDEKVDLVFSNHAFEHFADLDEVMKGVQKIIKPGGYLFIAVPTYYRNKSSLSKRWMNSSHYSLFTHNSLNNLLARYGFEEVAHTYSGWKKEVDDLWYLAKLTGKRADPAKYFENPTEVARYLRVINPMRSFLFYPVYSYWATRVRIYTAIRLFITSPKDFFRKASKHVKRKFAVN